MKATITDIAKDTGLSLATISKYLNNKPVLPENMKKIEESIERLHYVPNQIAQGLRSKKTKTIALILPSLENCLWGKIVNPIEISLKSLGFMSLVCTSKTDEKYETTLLNFLLHNQVCGVIAVEHSLDSETISILAENDIPVVCIDYIPEYISVDTVCSDNYQKGCHAAQYFIRHKHQVLSVIGGDTSSYIIQQRKKGFLDTLKNARLTPGPEYCIYGVDSLETAQKSLKKILALPKPPTGIVFLNYLVSLGCLAEIVNSQITVPSHLSVICFDHDTLFDALLPNVTSVEENYELLGKNAVELLIKRITEENKNPLQHRNVPAIFYDKDSVADAGVL
ncbi:MAG: LacI family DNA-binding transcriptional regulator [Eubacteriales bacterium]|nr:LacI family DNA-binding transcriptional regulator [Eubacteriales bacterium]